MSDMKNNLKKGIDSAASKVKDLGGKAIDKTKTAASAAGEKVKAAGKELKDAGK
jgi:hypothetical protein